MFSPLWAFDVRVGRNPSTPGSTFEWELDPVNQHHDTAGDWSGHCNQAATASVIFAEPAAGFDWQQADSAGRWLKLNGEGLKILATEFAGHRVQIETLFTIDPYLGTDQMINPALVVAGIRDTLPARVGAMSPAKARLGEYGRKMLASRYLQRVTNVTPGCI